MQRFIALIDFTPQGMGAIDKTIERADAFRGAAEELGAKVRDIYWTVGSHDGVLIFDAPDAPTASSLMLHLGRAGYVKTETLRALDRNEMTRVLQKL